MYYDSVCIYAFMHQHMRGLLGTSQIPAPTSAQCLLAKNQIVFFYRSRTRHSLAHDATANKKLVQDYL